MRNRTHTFTCIMAAMGLAAGLAGAQQDDMEEYGFMKEDWTMTLGGNGTSDKDFDTTIATVELGLEYFLTDTVAGAVRQGVSAVDQPGENAWNGSTRLALDYFFPVSPVVPYLGANLGYIYGDGVEESFIGGPEGGIRAFVSESTFINFMVEYQFLFEDADGADEAFDDGRFVYTMGLGVRF